MSDRKWTPGPWVVSRIAGKLCEVGSKETDMNVCDCWGLLDESYAAKTKAEVKANAHLIAAAPELYEALAFAVACNVGNGKKPMWLDEARAALAKARGESQ